DQPPIPHEVVHEVFARSQPYLRRHFEIEVHEPLGRHQAAIRDAASEMRILRTENYATHSGVDPVSADERLDSGAGAVLELHLYIVSVVDEGGEAVSDMQALLGQGASQRVQNVRAMHLVVRRAKSGLHRFGERCTKKGPAVVPSTLMHCQRLNPNYS